MNYHNIKSLFLDRISVREYLEKNISHNLILEIIDAAKYAPTSCNRQSFKVKIVKKHIASFDSLANVNYGGAGFARKAPVLLLVLVDIRSYFMPDEINFPISDGSIFASYIMLAARSMGLDTCWISWQTSAKNKRKIFDLFKIPKHYFPICVLTLGYRKSNVIESPREDASYYIL